MTVEIDTKYWICQTDDDTFLAASTETPRFCFAGATEEEVVGKATRALSSYFNNEFRPVAKKQAKVKPSISISKLRPVRVHTYVRESAVA